MDSVERFMLAMSSRSRKRPSNATDAISEQPHRESTLRPRWALHNRLRGTTTPACECINLRNLDYNGKHTQTCPMQERQFLGSWCDIARLLEDPSLVHSNRAMTVAPQKETRDMIAIYAHFALHKHTSHDNLFAAGCARIDRYVAIVNFVRKNIDGCDKFYCVTDALLKHYFAQLLPIIVGDAAFAAFASELYAYARLRPVKPQSFVTTARQIGKTTTMSIAMLGVICCADGGTDLCKVYATKQDQAILMLKELKRCFDLLPANLRPATVLKDNVHTLEIVSDYNGQSVCIEACCANVTGIRGQRPRIVIVDEYQMTEADLWLSHIWPIVGKIGYYLICASTPGEPGSYMAAETLKYKNCPSTAPLVVVFDYSLICDMHRSMDQPLLCRCKLQYLPPWRSATDLSAEKMKYTGANEKNYIREMLGEPPASGARVLDPRLVHAIFDAPHVPLGPLQGNVIYVAVDPADGGDSECAIMSFGYTKEGRLLILALDTCTTKRVGAIEIMEYVQAHVTKLRRLKPEYTQYAYFVPLVECQGFAATIAETIVVEILKGGPSLELVGFKVDKTMKSRGTPITHTLKDDMVIHFQKHVLSSGLLGVAEPCTTSGMRSNERGNTVFSSTSDLLIILCDQLCRLFYDESKVTGVKHITGKLGPGYKDDLAMAMFTGIYWSWKLRTTHPELVFGNAGNNITDLQERRFFHIE